MKFSVGFQLYDYGEEPFSHIVDCYKEHISEVFFSWQDIANGRSAVATRHGYTDWSTQERTEQELIAMKKVGMKLDLLFNANCYGQYAVSEKLSNSIVSTIEYLEKKTGGIDIVTTTSLFVADCIKKHFPEIETRASVNMRIGTIKAMDQVSDLFDSFHVQREYNRNLSYLRELRAWADANGKKLIMLANSGCFSYCAGQTFHDNLVAHESEISEVRNVGNFNPFVCRRMLKDKNNWHTLLENTWIRPEDLHNYDEMINTVKLATRVHSLPGLVIDAYSRRSFYGNTLDLFEPGLGPLIAPFVIDNQLFPEDWFTKTSSCDKMCHRCGYCKSVFQKVLTKAGDSI